MIDTDKLIEFFQHVEDVCNVLAESIPSPAFPQSPRDDLLRMAQHAADYRAAFMKDGAKLPIPSSLHASHPKNIVVSLEELAKTWQ